MGMIAWTAQFPFRARPLAYFRLMKARVAYHDYLVPTFKKPFGLGFKEVGGYQRRLAMLRNKHQGRRCFVIANGPGLQDIDMAPLRGEVTIGCNGIYKAFPEWGFKTTYTIFEDTEQIELRRHEIGRLKGTVKMTTLYNAYAFPADKHTLLFSAPRPRSHLYYWTDLYPQFSRDFAVTAHLGSSVTYLMLQLAYHLGCDPVYIIGLDHDYGELPHLFPPGKIRITEENIHLIQGLHFTSKYYKVGDQIGVPDVERQEQAYSLAMEEFQKAGRKLLNASARSSLQVIPRCDYDSIFMDAHDETDLDGGEELLSDAEFQEWESGRPTAWRLFGGDAERLSEAPNGDFKEFCLKLNSHNSKNNMGFVQRISEERAIEGKRVTFRLDGKSATSHALGLNISYKRNGERTAYSRKHSGGDRWEVLAHEVLFPSDIDPGTVEVLINVAPGTDHAVFIKGISARAAVTDRTLK